MQGARILSAMAAAIILATSASGECASANVHVDVQVDTESSTPVQPKKRMVSDYAEMAEGIYTGLIVDCRGLGLKTAMSPTIKNINGTKIYGHKNLDVDKIIAMGMVDYVSDSGRVERAGTNPLIIRAVALDNFNRDPVVSLEDSNRILVENYATKFLKALKVVFLYD
ncbi:MAG: hypothetical protein IJQ01_00100 [Selenomonadaceae bacterium]|nr:hypothetical protein [Selenomonadaceae bacterium]